MSDSTMKHTFTTFTTADGQNRLAVLIDEQIVCRAPSLRPDTKRHTEPGSAVWVLSEGSKSLGRLERQLKDGSRVLRAVETKAEKARLSASILTGVSYLPRHRPGDAGQGAGRGGRGPRRQGGGPEGCQSTPEEARHEVEDQGQGWPRSDPGADGFHAGPDRRPRWKRLP